MTALVRGANTVVAPPQQDGLVVGVRWTAVGVDCDLVALVCDGSRRVLSDEHFVFFNNPVSPESAVRVLQVPQAVPGGDVAQVHAHLAGLPRNAERIVVALAALAEGASLDGVSNLGVTAFDPSAGTELAGYQVGEEGKGTACLILAEIYRHSGAWKFRAVGQGYDSGLRGLGRDYGVDVE